MVGVEKYKTSFVSNRKEMRFTVKFMDSNRDSTILAASGVVRGPQRREITIGVVDSIIFDSHARKAVIESNQMPLKFKDELFIVNGREFQLEKKDLIRIHKLLSDPSNTGNVFPAGCSEVEAAERRQVIDIVANGIDCFVEN
jgi:hypothetical protein